jgi:hypothetical protein
MQNPTPPENGQNWLRHREGAQTALIDAMLLGEGHTLDEMAEALDQAFPDRDSRPEERIRGHLDHLQGGGPRDNPNQEPHHLSVVQEADGKWHFGY